MEIFNITKVLDPNTEDLNPLNVKANRMNKDINFLECFEKAFFLHSSEEMIKNYISTGNNDMSSIFSKVPRKNNEMPSELFLQPILRNTCVIAKDGEINELKIVFNEDENYLSMGDLHLDKEVFLKSKAIELLQCINNEIVNRWGKIQNADGLKFLISWEKNEKDIKADIKMVDEKTIFEPVESTTSEIVYYKEGPSNIEGVKKIVADKNTEMPLQESMEVKILLTKPKEKNKERDEKTVYELEKINLLGPYHMSNTIQNDTLEHVKNVEKIFKEPAITEKHSDQKEDRGDFKAQIYYTHAILNHWEPATKVSSLKVDIVEKILLDRNTEKSVFNGFALSSTEKEITTMENERFEKIETKGLFSEGKDLKDRTIAHKEEDIKIKWTKSFSETNIKENDKVNESVFTDEELQKISKDKDNFTLEEARINPDKINTYVHENYKQHEINKNGNEFFTPSRTEILEKVEKVVEKFFQRKDSPDLIIKFKIEEQDILQVALKREGASISVNVKSTNHEILNIINTQKELIIKNLQEKDIAASIYIYPDGKNGGEGRQYSGDERKNYRKKGNKNEFFKILMTQKS